MSCILLLYKLHSKVMNTRVIILLMLHEYHILYFLYKPFLRWIYWYNIHTCTVNNSPFFAKNIYFLHCKIQNKSINIQPVPFSVCCMLISSCLQYDIWTKLSYDTCYKLFNKQSSKTHSRMEIKNKILFLIIYI